MFVLICLIIVIIFLLLRYQEAHFLESEYTKEELFKLCSAGKVDMYSCVNGGSW